MSPDAERSFLERVARGAASAGATVGDGAFNDGPAVRVGRRDVAHFDADGALDLRLTRGRIRERREALRADPRVTLRRGSSDWLEVRIATGADEEFALDLAVEAATANAVTRRS